MKFTINRETILRPLQYVAGVVERRQTLPVLANVLIILDNNELSLTGTDLEVEFVAKIPVDLMESAGETTVPAKKLLDICKSLPTEADIEFSVEEQKAVIKSGRSRFSLSTLPSTEFPNLEDGPGSLEFTIPQKRLKHLIDHTQFAMAQQDVRYYLNGMLVEICGQRLRSVATDGHRLALCDAELEQNFDQLTQVIVPRKGILELARLVSDSDDLIKVVIGTNHIKVTSGDITFTSKLVDGKFPDYDRVLPKGGDISIIADRETLKAAMARASILSNEKYRGVRLTLDDGQMTIVANNPEQEEAQEVISIDYNGKHLEVGFNVSYLLDVMTVTKDESVRITLADTNSSALIEEESNQDAMYVVMPMRL